jgi:hypothetical protein
VEEAVVLEGAAVAIGIAFVSAVASAVGGSVGV